MIKLPRWLHHPRFAAEVCAADTRYHSEGKNGVLLVEVHYRNGVPVLGKMRDWLLPPVLLEVGLLVTASTS